MSRCEGRLGGLAASELERIQERATLQGTGHAQIRVCFRASFVAAQRLLISRGRCRVSLTAKTNPGRGHRAPQNSWVPPLDNPLGDPVLPILRWGSSDASFLDAVEHFELFSILKANHVVRFDR